MKKAILAGTSSRRHPRFAHFKFFSFSVIAFVIAFMGANNLSINAFASRFLYSNIREVPTNEYGLLLGTSRYVRKGVPNQYFHHRIQAAVTLLRLQKIKKIIVSGDNRHPNYNEPAAMRSELLKAGIPDSLIILEKGGYRTKHSIYNLKDSLHVTQVTIITQCFHNQRAVFLAHAYGIQAIGFCAEDICYWKGIRIRFREYFAKTAAYLEVDRSQ